MFPKCEMKIRVVVELLSWFFKSLVGFEVQRAVSEAFGPLMKKIFPNSQEVVPNSAKLDITVFC